MNTNTRTSLQARDWQPCEMDALQNVEASQRYYQRACTAVRYTDQIAQESLKMVERSEEILRKAGRAAGG